ncbi:MAG: ARMT1-like domain-containing protein, partial [Bacteroidales bacterium]|nr:ARMT1-like domain-containing protein [Bacteroidales bacterium]
MNPKCLFCFSRAFEKLLFKPNISSEEKVSYTKEFFAYLSTIDENALAPKIARDIHAKFREILNNNDPYKEEKKFHNKSILNIYSELEKKVRESRNPFNTALRLAIAGNIIDFGPAQKFDIEGTIKKVENSDFAIDNSKELKNAIEKANNILYLGDNSGEIVFDKLFLQTINHPNVYFAVRGAPVINDVTIDEAKFVGIDKFAKIISNGYDAPSTLIEYASDEFLDVYNKA